MFTWHLITNAGLFCMLAISLCQTARISKPQFGFA
jgi:hypothetical protein